MNTKKYIVYEIINKKNGYKFVGSTSGSLNKALSKHKNGFKNKQRTSIFDDVIHNEGIENFEISIIQSGLTPSERSSIRAKAIEKHRKAGVSYNLSKPTSAERTKSVAQFSLDGELIRIFKSRRDTAQSLNLKDAGIKSCCFGTTLTFKNFIFLYPDDYCSQDELLAEVKRRSIRRAQFDEKRKNALKRGRKRLESRKKTVAQFSLDGNLVEMHPSCRIASEKLGFSLNSIKSCCYGNCKTLKGFVFIYPDDFSTDEEILEEVKYRVKRKRTE